MRLQSVRFSSHFVDTKRETGPESDSGGYAARMPSISATKHDKVAKTNDVMLKINVYPHRFKSKPLFFYFVPATCDF